MVGDQPLAQHPLCGSPYAGTRGFWRSWLRLARGTWDFLQAHFATNSPHTFGADGLWLRAIFLGLGEVLDDRSDVCRQKLHFCIAWTL